MQRDSSNSTTSARPQSRHQFNGTGRRAPQQHRRFSQASLRRGLRSYDQHGRPWYVETEIRSGMPTGRWQPEFQAPWYPDQKYFVINTENTAEMYINYPLMRADRRSANAEYHHEAVKLAAEKEWAIPVYGRPYPQEIINSLGNPPQPIQPIVAAEQENPWIMGWSSRPDSRLVPFMPRRRKALTIEEEGYDFSEATYHAAAAAVDAPRASGKPRTAKSLAELLSLVEPDGPERPLTPPSTADVVAEFDEPDIGDSETHDTRLVDEEDGVAAFDAGGGDEAFEKLLDLEEEIDPEGTGGKKVEVKTGPKAERAERRPFPKTDRAKPRRDGSAPPAKPTSKGERRTIAQGARPVVADG